MACAASCGAVLAGATQIIAVDLNDATLETAKKFGATHVINSGTSDPIAEVKKLTEGFGVKYVFDVVGIPATAIQGVFMGSGVPKRDIAALADLYLNGRLNLDDLVSEEIALSQINEGYSKLKDPQVNRVVITDFAN